TYALKTFRADGSGRNFQHEINMFVAAGPNNNVLKYSGAVQDPNGKFALFELCRPFDLSELLRSCGRLTDPEVCYFGLGIAAGLAAGLAHLHKKNIIHSDLKPENVLMTFDMQVRIGDLGLSERYNFKRWIKGCVGTMHFIAPEVVDMKPHTLHMDTFSFGCIIYMMLLGTRAHLTTLDCTYPNQLEENLSGNQESEDPEDWLSANAQSLLRALLSFHPFTRPMPRYMAMEKVFLECHRPTKLTEDVFHTPYIPVDESKRKDAPTEEETKVVQKTKRDNFDGNNFQADI
ncbi:Inactive serine/threonine-protein kinase plk5, partial [Linnemannia gamsii]